MDENMPEDNSRERAGNSEFEREDSAKRMRTDFDQEECSISLSENTSHSNENDSIDPQASTSSDSGLVASAGSSAELETNGNKAGVLEKTRHSTDENSDRTVSVELDNSAHSSPFFDPSNCPNTNRSEQGSLSLDSDIFSSRMTNSSSENTILYTDTESDEDCQVDELLKKEKPKHNWFVVPEIINRQIGYGSKRSNPVLFQQRCYGSLMNVQKLELMYKLEDHEGCVNSLNFSPNGNLLASGSDDLKVVIWDWRIGKSILKLDTRHKRNIFQTKFLDLKGPDLHLATCGRDGQVTYMQIGCGGHTDIRKLGQHKGPCHKLAVLKDQPHVVLSAGEDGVVFNHDVRRNCAEKVTYVQRDLREVALYSIHSNPLNSNEFCVAGRDCSVRVYDQRNSDKVMAKYCPYKSTDPKYNQGLHITCAVYNHDGSEILASYNEDDIFLFDTDSGPGQYAHKYSGHRNEATIKGVSFFGPRSEFIMSGSDCAHMFIWERKTESIVQFLLADDSGVVNCLEPHPELPFLATSGLDWIVKLWVPSCEDEPSLDELPDTLKFNKNSLRGNNAGSDSQVIWMLWRRLMQTRGGARHRLGYDAGEAGFSVQAAQDTSEDSSSDSWESHSEDDDLAGAAGCTTS